MAAKSENEDQFALDSKGRSATCSDALCDACGAVMRAMGHCKYWCLRCGFLRTCNDVI